ncbi:N-acetylmuramoyl-L-alanine amidase [Tamaricihabitans halophyticus]|uniref:N-acetylmuramoyl-L-alanine amidase n=1 Tax=Tamaricihabitans halophyticus TaxID=1262583 RepID=A0A4R2QXA8_9PSEU|nr:N-acetylmuramoyl-L-alanine amidase [Tamaricihabitans halophyticus]TCP54810.1 N-acetylmuramoyl-L-alanine amidase [Tamaricihabitans halophyticus]
MAFPTRPLGRRTLLQGGLTVTAFGAIGLAVPQAAGALTRPARALSSKAAPEIHGTADWGARSPNGTIEVLDQPPIWVAVHHTAGGNSDDTSLEHAFSLSRGIQNFHMDDRGWVDSGQQFTNSRGGHITEGRHESLNALNDGGKHVVGAHVGDHNSDAVGIENEGTYTEVDVPDALWNSLVELVSHMCSQFGIPASEIYGHRDYNSTECPGEVLYGRLPELRDAVGARLGQEVKQPTTWRLVQPGDTGPEVLAGQHLLRAQGMSVPTDGVFGASTQRAVAELESRYGITPAACSAVRKRPETGLLGAGIWPILATTVRPGDQGPAAKAAQVLLDAKGRSSRIQSTIDTSAWKQLLAK